MKKTIIIIAIIILLSTKIFCFGIPVIDFAAIASQVLNFAIEVKKWGDIFGDVANFQERYLKNMDKRLFAMLGIDQDTIDLLKMGEDFYEFFIDSPYFQDLNELESWYEIFNNADRLLSKYENIDKFEYLKDSILYRNNEGYRKLTKDIIEVNKEILEDQKNKLQLITAYRKIDKERVKLLKEFMDKWERYSKGDSDNIENEAAMMALLTRIQIERLVITEQIQTMIRNKTTEKLKTTIRVMDNSKKMELMLKKETNYQELLKIGEEK